VRSPLGCIGGLCRGGNHVGCESPQGHAGFIVVSTFI